MTFRNILFIFILILTLISVYSISFNNPFRGEMWDLIYIQSLHKDYFDQIKNVFKWICFGAERIQPLAYLIPFSFFRLFEMNFQFYYILSLFFHLLSGLLVFCITKKITNKNVSAFLGLVFFIFNFISSDLLNWPFLSYIQIHLILLLSATFLFFEYLDKKKYFFLILSSLLSLIAIFIYEASFAFFIAQLLTVLFLDYKVSKKKILIDFIPPFFCIVVFFLIGYLLTNLNFNDSNTSLNLNIFLKPFVYLFIFFRYSLGLTANFRIDNIPRIIERDIEIDFYSSLILIFLIISLLILLKKQKFYFLILKKKLSLQIIFLLIFLFTYILILSFAKVTTEDTFFVVSQFESAPRYYYFSSAIFSILIFYFIDIKSKHLKVYFLTFFIFIIIGNINNIIRFNLELSKFQDPVRKYIEKLRTINQNNTQKILMEYHFNWYYETINANDMHKLFVFNANRCNKHYNNLKQKIEIKEKFFFDNNFNFLKSYSESQKLHKISNQKININSSSYFKGAEAKNLIDKNINLLWHTNHKPIPPYEVTFEITFKDDLKKSLKGIGFKPRPNHTKHFWKSATIQLMDKNYDWKDLVDLKNNEPPKDKWVYYYFNNSLSANKYRIIFKGGFENYRFYSMSAISFFE